MRLSLISLCCERVRHDANFNTLIFGTSATCTQFYDHVCNMYDHVKVQWDRKM